MITVRKAILEDVPHIADMLEEVIELLARSEVNYPNWHKGKYPTPEVPRAAHERGDLYVAEKDGVIVGTVTVNGIEAPEYEGKDWQYKAEKGKISVIHTLAVSPKCRGEGVARKLMEYAHELAKEKGDSVVRLDTYHKNAPAMKLYEDMGYRKVGYVVFTDIRPEGEDYAIFEKQI